MAGVKNREGAGLLADGKKTDEDSSTKNSEKKRRKKQGALILLFLKTAIHAMWLSI